MIKNREEELWLRTPPLLNGTLQHTNCYLLETKHFHQRQQLILHIPVYFRVIVKNLKYIETLDISEISAKVYLTFLFTVFTAGLPRSVIDCLSDQMVINLKKDKSIRLSNPEPAYLDKKKSQSTNNPDYLIFTQRELVSMAVEPHAFLTPFEVIDLIATITLRTV